MFNVDYTKLTKDEKKSLHWENNVLEIKRSELHIGDIILGQSPYVVYKITKRKIFCKIIHLDDILLHIKHNKTKDKSTAIRYVDPSFKYEKFERTDHIIKNNDSLIHVVTKPLIWKNHFRYVEDEVFLKFALLFS